MTRTINVSVGEPPRQVGVLRFESKGARAFSSFAYTDEWLGYKDRFAIDPTLGLFAGPQFRARSNQGSVFHGAFADSEPDGWGAIVIKRDHNKRRNAAKDSGLPFAPAVLTHLDYLLGVDDFSRIGALRFRDESGDFARPPRNGQHTTPPLLELGMMLAASRAIEADEETAADLAYLQGRGTSLGGMRPKCTVLDGDGRLAIGKFPSIGDQRPVTKGEVLAMNLAARAGINAAPARLAYSDGLPVALIQRFDRAADGRRIPYISAATLLGIVPEEETVHHYTDIADSLRQYGAQVNADLEELWRRMVFSVLITNLDDHMRNHGFLHDGGGKWRLSPAFDINPFPDRVREFKTWISPEGGPDASIDNILSVTAYFRISAGRAKQIVGEVEAAVAQWKEVGRGLDMTPADLEKFEPAFEHKERDAAQRVGV